MHLMQGHPALPHPACPAPIPPFSLLHHLISRFSPSLPPSPPWLVCRVFPFNETVKGSSVGSTNLLCQASQVCPAHVFLCLWQCLGFSGRPGFEINGRLNPLTFLCKGSCKDTSFSLISLHQTLMLVVQLYWGSPPLSQGHLAYPT